MIELKYYKDCIVSFQSLNCSTNKVAAIGINTRTLSLFLMDSRKSYFEETYRQMNMSKISMCNKQWP